MPESQGRETRILLLIVVVSIALLLMLARLRYPAADLPVIAPTQAPLTTVDVPRGFEDLSHRLSTLHATVSARLLLLETESTPVAAGRRGVAPAQPGTVAPGPALAVLVRPDVAVMYMPRGQQLRASSAPAVELLFRDEGREMAVLRVPPNMDGVQDHATAEFSGMAFVGVLIAARQSATIQPAFVGSAAAVADQRWPSGLIDWGPISVGPPGSVVFTLDGKLLGLLTTANGGTVLVPAAALDDLAARPLPGTPAQ